MFDVATTEEFDEWLSRLKDNTGKAKIVARIRRLSLGNPGSVNAVGEGISELKIDFGPGYRIYYKQIGEQAILILGGGDKDSQAGDIKRAKTLAADLKG
jgi:putative addiction module killer protein